MGSLRGKVEAELEHMDQGTRGRGSKSKGECPRERWILRFPEKSGLGLFPVELGLGKAPL